MTAGRAPAALWCVRAGTLGFQAVHFGIVARLLDRADFGGFVGALAILTLAGAVAEFGLVQTVVLGLQRRPGESGRVAREASFATVGLTVVSLVLALPLAWLVLPSPGRVATLALVPWYVVSRLALPHLAVRQHQLRFGRVAAGDVAARLVPLAALALAWPAVQSWSAGGRLSAVGASLLGGAAASLGVLRVRAEGEMSAVAAVGLVRRALPLGATGALSLVHTRVDQVVLSAYGKRLALASYGIAYRVLDAALALATAAGAATFPALARATGEARAELGRRTCALLALVGFATGLVAFVLAPQLTALLGGGRYPEAAWLLRLLTPALAVSTVNLGVAQLAVVEGRGRRLVGIAATGVTLNLTLNVLLDGHHGARAAAVATVVSEVVGFALVWRLAVRARPGCVAPATVVGPLVAFFVAAFGGLWLWHGVGAMPAVLLAVAAIAVGVSAARPVLTPARPVEVLA